MASSFAALLVHPFPCSSSSSEDSDEPILLPPPPAHEEQRPWWSLERDCNVLMKALARSGEVDQVVGLFAGLRSSASRASAAPGVLCYNTFLNALAEAGRVGEVDAVLDEMEVAGVPLNVSTLNIVVKLHAWRLAQFEAAYRMVLWFQRKGVEPDVGTYSTFITGLCRAGRLDEAFGVLDSMLEVGCLPMVHTYTPIVQGYCSEGRIQEAKNLVAMMECAGCPPNVVTYNVLIRALCEDARFDEVKEILAETGAKGWKPSTVTYNTYMNGLCKKGMAKEALQQLDAMLGQGLDLTTFTLSIILNCLCHNSKVLEAVCLLQRSAEFNCCAGVVAYNTVMSRLCDLGRWRRVLQLLTDMIKRGVTPNTRTLNILIHSLCKGGKSSTAKSLVCNQEVAANVVTYNTLIHWFCNCGKYGEVEDLISHMYAANIARDEVTFTILVDALCRERKFKGAIHYFNESLESGSLRDLLKVLINRLVNSGRTWEICLIFRDMREKGKGFPPDYNTFDHTIRSCCKVGFCHPKENYRVNFILDAMLGLEKKGNSAHRGQEKG